MTTPSEWDIAVIGAGPAGLAAAVTAAKHGASTLLLDEQPTPGGQIYRAIETTPIADRAVLGRDYWHGAGLVAALRQSGAVYRPGATVWAITDSREIGYTVDGQGHSVRARQIVLATGAVERPVPIAGWTLPGVMTAGAGQILLKTAGLVPGRGTVLAGSGPLLWLLASQYLRAGFVPDAILDTTPASTWRRAAAHLPSFAIGPYALKGLQLVAGVRHRVKVWRNATEIAAEGEDAIARIRFTCDGAEQVLPAETLFVHQGVVPNTSMARALGCELAWNAAQACWTPRVDRWGAASRDGIFIAGDGAGISGARAAEHLGRIAALGALTRLGAVTQNRAVELAAPAFSQLRTARRGRTFLDLLFQPARSFRAPRGGEILACRCEEVSAAAIREAAASGHSGPNQIKAMLRCGMGPCQSRMCGLTLTEIIADETGCSSQQVGSLRLRQPLKPVSLSELATLSRSPTDIAATNPE